MAEQTFTPAERQALLNYRGLRRQHNAYGVANTLGQMSSEFTHDPWKDFEQPGADNLTAAQRAQMKVDLAKVLAMLAEQERAAQSSDQDYQSKKAIIAGDIVIALIQADATKDKSAKELGASKVGAYAKLQQDAIDREKEARISLNLTPEGSASVQEVQSMVQGRGVINSQAVLQKIDADLGTLEKTNPAQIRTYVDRVNAAFRASGRPEWANFDLTDQIGNLDGQATDPILLRQLGSKLQRGLDASIKAEGARDEAAAQRDQAHDLIIKAGGSADPALQRMIVKVADMVTEEPTRDMSQQVKAPPPDASPDEKRAYVERASQGQSTVDEQGQVIPAGPVAPAGAPQQPPMSYEGFTRAYPGIDVLGGGSASGGPGLVGQGYSRSGPTADTVAAMRALRANIQKQMEDLDKPALSPLEQARREAEGVSATSEYSNPRFAERAAERTAAAENRQDRRGDRALRDTNVLTGQEAAPLTEKAGALVRQGGRALVGAAGQGVRSLLSRRAQPPTIQAPDLSVEPQPSVSSPAASAALVAASGALAHGDIEGAHKELQRVVANGTPDQKRAAAKLYHSFGGGWDGQGPSYEGYAKDAEVKADDLEYQQENAARAANPREDDPAWDPRRPKAALVTPEPTAQQTAKAQDILDTDPTFDHLDPWQPKVPGRKNLLPEAGKDYAPPDTSGTLAEKTGKDPLSAVFSMGDLGTQKSKEQAQSPDAEPQVPFTQPEADRPKPKPVDLVRGMGATLGDDAEQAEPERPPAPIVDPDELSADYWLKFQRQANPDAAAKTAASATNVLDMPDLAQPDPGAALRKRQQALVNGVAQ